jgi:glycosyltransferase involved in cell wall biosynthesis
MKSRLKRMRIAIVTDAWKPQINGVVRTYENLIRELETLGHEILAITPDAFRTVPCPTYPSIRLVLWPWPVTARRLDAFQADTIHIATEGPLGHAARRYCLQRSIPFTTSFHTRFPEYIRLRLPVPLRMSYAYLRRFHGRACRTLVATASLQQYLRLRGFENAVLWPRGVDTGLFYPRGKHHLDFPRPIFMYLGRVAVEKNLEAFLSLDLPGSKVVIGDGPDLEGLNRHYPGAHFAGSKEGEELARLLSSADVLVFPSLTDTYGLVMLEAMACGVPVAAFPVQGPLDIVQHGFTGILDKDLRLAALAALKLDPGACVEFARHHSWRQCAESFLANLECHTGRLN